MGFKFSILSFIFINFSSISLGEDFLESLSDSAPKNTMVSTSTLLPIPSTLVEIRDIKANEVPKPQPQKEVKKENIKRYEEPVHVLSLDFSSPQVDMKEIIDGGVVLDEIPALVDPATILIPVAEKNHYYTDDEYMAVIEINGDARAYPLRILNWHQGVNAEIGGQPIFMAYDPLSANIFAMDRRVYAGKEPFFGVTGQVYRSTSIYYDKATKSTWSPYENKAITGLLSGTRMKRYEAMLTTWKSYKEAYPEGKVMDLMNTGYERNYRQNPYGNYARNSQILFPVAYTNRALPKKEYVVGVRLYKGSKHIEVAIPINVILSHESSRIEFMFDEIQVPGSRKIPVTFEVKTPTGFIEVTSPDSDVVIEKSYGFWFAWSAHNPKSRVVTSLK